MPIVSNQFWVAANILMDTSTGATTPVLMLVNREVDATRFYTEQEARNYFVFVQNRAKNIDWFVDYPTPARPAWVIRGVQRLEVPPVLPTPPPPPPPKF